MRRRAVRSDGAARGRRPEVDSLKRGLELMRLFTAECTSLELMEIVERSAIPRPTAARLLETLVSHGFLHRSMHDERFSPATGCLVIGHTFRSGMQALPAMSSAMQAVADRLKLDVLLATREGANVLVLERAGPTVSGSTGAGTVLPMENTAPGRALLWAMATTEQAQVLDAVRRESPGRMAAIYGAFQDIETHGTCVSADGPPGMVAVAAPVGARGDDRALVVSLSASGPGEAVRSETLLLANQIAMLAPR